MSTRGPHDWMWDDALETLARAERLHQQFFQPTPARNRQAHWTPPVDVLESEGEVLVIVALPGVSEADVQLVIDGAHLVIAGERAVSPEMRTATIHRLELPQGRFERRVPLPPGVYDQIRRRTSNGCLLVSLRKAR
ncbi:MAG: Hsp20/alpha crystallin family protein [Caulobacteraceae bacterium]